MKTSRLPWGAEWDAERVIAALAPLVGEARRQRLLQVFAKRLESVNVLLDAPHDPHNGAAILRSCEAFGIQEVHVLPRVERFLVAQRVARGTQGWVDVVEHPTIESALVDLRARGFELIAADPRGELIPDQLSQLPRVTLVIGNEHQGIHEELRRACSRSVRVPMRGFVESLNVSVSTAILLAAATQDRAGDLPARRLQELYARGLYRTLPRAEELLGALKKAMGQPSTPSCENERTSR